MEGSNGADPSIWHLPGGIALVITLYKTFISRYGKRIEDLEKSRDNYQTKVDARDDKQELRDDIRVLRSELGGKLDVITSALLSINGNSHR
jgi:hypothetical protein